MDPNRKQSMSPEPDVTKYGGPRAARRLPAREGLVSRLSNEPADSAPARPAVAADAPAAPRPGAAPTTQDPATPLAGGLLADGPWRPVPTPLAGGPVARRPATPQARLGINPQPDRTVSLARPASVPLAPLAGSSPAMLGRPATHPAPHPAPLGAGPLPARATSLAGGPATPLAGVSRSAAATRPPSRTGVAYRGLPEPIRVVGWLAIAIVIGGVLGATGPTAFERIAAVAAAKPGLLPWYCVRALGILAYLVLAGSVVYGLLLSTKILDVIAHRPVSFALHKDLAIVALILGTAHGVMLTLDQSFSFTPLAILVPFESPYSPISVGVGQLTLYLSAIVTASFYVRRRIGQKSWRLIHYVTFLVFIGSSAHGIFAGSDSGTPWAFWLYLLPVTAVVFLTTYRIVISVAARTGQPQVERAGIPGALPASRGPLDRPGARSGAASGGSPWPM